MTKRVLTDEQLKTLFWYLSKLLKGCVSVKDAKENCNLKYDWDISTFLQDMSGMKDLNGENVKKDYFYGNCMRIIEKEKDMDDFRRGIK